MTIPAYSPPVLTTECPACKGSGKNEITIALPTGPNYTIQSQSLTATCSVCNGTGKVLEPVKRGEA